MILPVKDKWLECPIKNFLEVQFFLSLLNKTRNHLFHIKQLIIQRYFLTFFFFFLLDLHAGKK